MKKHIVTTAASLLLAATLTQPALADNEWPAEASGVPAATAAEQVLLAQAFAGDGLGGAALLDGETMQDTRGELWPFVVSVVGLDLALSSYFWGVYVPAVSGGNGCVTCSLAVTAAQH